MSRGHITYQINELMKRKFNPLPTSCLANDKCNKNQMQTT